jgi:erythronate-4-phosphate dehydrogenase
MKLVVDENIPQGKEAFGTFGNVVFSAGREITNNLLKDADALIVRSITQVNEELLKKTPVKFVGTATIGTDHIDKNYLEKSGICFADAAGCNAFSVAEYVICAINQYLTTTKKSFSEMTIGVVGCGNVGSKVVEFSKALGMNVLINDPPLERISSEKKFCSFDDTLSADIITFHVPLNKTGIDKTVHLLNETNIGKIKSRAMLINSSRGPVVKNDSLLKRLKEKDDLFSVLDVWEGEPALNEELLDIVNIGTPHIAGYSYEGKMNGTAIIYNKLCDFLKKEKNWKPVYPPIEKTNFLFNTQNNFEEEFNKLTSGIYNILFDNKNLKDSLSVEKELRPKYFDDLRKKYYIRREFKNYSIGLSQNDEKTKEILTNLRFTL